MDAPRKVSDNKSTEIIVKVETNVNGSSNSNLSSSQFGPRYTEIDISTC
jgi:hypothetical protein